MDFPARFGKYELLERIAVGGMAEVFLARSFGLGGFEKRLVIKRILPGLSRSPRFVSMFIKEARVSAGLNHPNLIQVFELGKVDGDHYIAMEHIHGKDLTRTRRFLAAEGRRMPMPLAVYATAAVLRGLSYAHSCTDSKGQPLNLVHRDVSPHNVIVTFQGEVKLVDFGIARLLGEADPKPGQPGGGKYAYMSPEQATGQPLDHRTDIYSSGILLYELLVGHRLFQDPDPQEKLRLVREAIVPDPREQVPVPDSLWQILRRMLARDPADRPPRAEEAEEELRAFLFGEGLRVDASDLAAFMRGLFSDEASLESIGVDLQGLAADLSALEARALPAGTDPGDTSLSSLTDAGDLPGLLKPGPGERRTVVVLSGEVTGFTDVSERLDPEDVARRHYRFLRRVRQAVDDTDGILDRYQDDSFLVFFGMERSGEYDLDKAMACASALRRIARDSERPLELAMGVHTGEVTVGRRVGRGFRYSAHGDTIKLAQRLSLAADLGEVLLSDRVVDASRGRFRVQPGPGLRLKGDRRPRPTFFYQGSRRSPVSGGGHWLLRGDEIEALRRALVELSQGRGRVLALRGEAGTGKSRLVRELRDLARAHQVPYYAARVLPVPDLPLAPFRELIGRLLGIDGGATPEQVRSSLGMLARLKLAGPDIEVVGALFGLSPSGRQSIDEQAMFDAALSLVRGLAQESPVILVIEDVHNMDGLEQRMLRHIAEAAREHPILYLLSCRGSFPAALVEPDEQIELTRVGTEVARALVADLLGVERVGRELASLVERTAEGNPLYICELVKALNQSERIQTRGRKAELVDGSEEPGLPPGLKGLIAARIDALDPACKGTLQVAATIGLEFGSALLAESAGLDDVAPIIEDLERHGLVSPERDGRHAFVSQLVWEGVSRSIMGVQQRDYHRMVANGIERLHQGQLEEHRQALARHRAAGGQPLEAARHALIAGERMGQPLSGAAEIWEEAIGWLSQATGLDPVEHARVEAALRLRVGEARALAGEPDQSLRHLEVALDLAGEVEDDEVEARALLALGRHHLAQGKSSMARYYLDTARELATERAARADVDPDLEVEPWAARVAVEALEALGSLAQADGQQAAADRYFEEAVKWAGQDEALAARAMLGMANRHIRVGEDGEALDLLHRALERAECASDRILAGRIVNNLGIVHYNARRYPEALSMFREALRIRQGIGYRPGVVANLHNLGDTHLRMGQDGRAFAAFEQSRDLAREIGWDRGVLMNEVFLAFLDGRRGDATACERLAELEARAGKLGALASQATAAWLAGRLCVRNGRTEQAQSALARAAGLAAQLDDGALARDVADAIDQVAAGV